MAANHYVPLRPKQASTAPSVGMPPTASSLGMHGFNQQFQKMLAPPKSSATGAAPQNSWAKSVGGAIGGSAGAMIGMPGAGHAVGSTVGGWFGGDKKPQPVRSPWNSTNPAGGSGPPKPAAQPDGFFRGIGRGFTGNTQPESSFTGFLGEQVGQTFSPTLPFQRQSWAGGGPNPIQDWAMSGGSPWGFGASALANRFAPGMVSGLQNSTIGRMVPGGPGAVTNALNLGRSALGYAPFAGGIGGYGAAPVAAFGLGASPTAALALYGGYAAGQAPVDLYNVATGATNLNARAGAQNNQGTLTNVGQNLIHPGEALASMGVSAPLSLAHSAYQGGTEYLRGRQLDQQLAALKARSGQQ